MIKKTSADHKDIIAFLELLSHYCVFYFGKKEGLELYNHYCTNYVYIIPAMKNGKHVYGEKFSRLQLIFTKIKADVFFSGIDTYHIKWPYDTGEIKQIDFELFDLTCCSFYEGLGERTLHEERWKLGFSKKILDLLLPPKKGLLFNHDEWNSKDTLSMERLYEELKKRDPDIRKEYGKSFREFSKNDFIDYVDKHLNGSSKQISYALWVVTKSE